MVKVVLLDQDGKQISPKSLTSAADLQDAANQARTLISACETIALQLRQAKNPADRQGGTPYLT